MDSFTLLQTIIRKHPVHHADHGVKYKVTALSFNYNQRHRKELEYAAEVCADIGIDHNILNLHALGAVAQGSALTDSKVEVPHGHYAEESMRQTVVPGRNTVMLAMGLAFAEGKFKDPSDRAVLYYGAHSGDHHIYPDCRPEFVTAMGETIRLASDHRVVLQAPFLMGNKISILKEGLSMGLSIRAYAKTWTCYVGGDKPCGTCGSCDERREAFAAVGVDDPAYGVPI